MKVSTYFPKLLLQQVSALKLSKKMDGFLKNLIGVCLEEYSEGGYDEYDFYKPLDQDYIKEVTSETFLKQYWPSLKYNYKKEDKNKSLEGEAIFQTDGSYKVKGYPMHYRINPLYMDDELVRVTLELNIEDISLNHLFPEEVDYFLMSAEKLQVNEKRYTTNLDEEIMIGQAGADDDVVILARNWKEGVALEQYEVPTFHVKMLTLFGKVKSINKDLSYVKAILKSERQNSEAEYPEDIKIILDGKRVVIDNVFDYIKKREKSATKAVKNKIKRIVSQDFSARISVKNGRLNTNLTNLPRFAVKYLEIEGSNLRSMDLKSSQVVIMANLMMNSLKLMKSLSNSKFPELKQYLDCFTSIDHTKYNVSEFLDYCVNKDIYELLAKGPGITRDLAKPIMLKILFTEPGYNLPKKYDVTGAFPDFFNYLKAIKVAFKDTFGNSKRSVAHFMQMTESHIFIEKIYSKLSQEDFPAFTKHDSVLVKADGDIINKTKTIIDAELKKLDFQGKIVQEDYRSVDVSDIQYNDPFYNMIIMDPDSLFPNEMDFLLFDE